MKKEPKFMVNSFLLESQKELEEILKAVKKKPNRYEKKALFLKEFTYGMYNAHKKLEKEFLVKKRAKILGDATKAKALTDEKLKLKKELEIKRQQLLSKLQMVRTEKFKPLDMPKKLPPLNVPLPPVEEKPEEYNLISSKVSGKGLVGVKYENRLYSLKEPTISSKEKEGYNLFLDKYGKKLKRKPELIDDKKFILKSLKKFFKKTDIPLNDELFEKLRYYYIRDEINLGKIEPLMADKNVKEIRCDGEGSQIKIKFKNVDDVKTNVILESKELNQILSKLSEKLRKPLTPETPSVEGKLPTGEEVVLALSSSMGKAKFIIKKEV